MCILDLYADRLGHSPHGGSGWCSLKLEQEKRSTGIFITILGNDLWVYLTVIMVTLLYLTTHYHIRRKVSGRVGGRRREVGREKGREWEIKREEREKREKYMRTIMVLYR